MDSKVDSKPIVKDIKLENAVNIAKKNPKTFFLPQKEDIDNIKTDTVIQVCDGLERFWCLVKKITIDPKTSENVYLCEINNELMNDQEYKLGDLILVKEYNIYEASQKKYLLNLKNTLNLRYTMNNGKMDKYSIDLRKWLNELDMDKM